MSDFESATTLMAVLISGASYIQRSAGWNEAGIPCSMAEVVVEAGRCAMDYRFARDLRRNYLDEALVDVIARRESEILAGGGLNRDD